MTNEFIEKYVPKKHQDAIADVYKDMDGYWITLKEGFISTSTETQTIHEYTLAETRKQLKTIVKEETEDVIEEVVEEEWESKDGLAILDQFLSNWKEVARKHYEDLSEEYFSEGEKEHEITPETLRKVYHFYTYKRTYSEERIVEIMEELPTMDQRDKRHLTKKVSRAMFKLWEEDHTKKDINIIQSMGNVGFLENILDREVATKRKNFISMIEKKAGDILDARRLRIGVDGSINGYIVGSKKEVSVQTIYAGGYNVQCLHYRILVK